MKIEMKDFFRIKLLKAALEKKNEEIDNKSLIILELQNQTKEMKERLEQEVSTNKKLRALCSSNVAENQSMQTVVNMLEEKALVLGSALDVAVEQIAVMMETRDSYDNLAGNVVGDVASILAELLDSQLGNYEDLDNLKDALSACLETRTLSDVHIRSIGEWKHTTIDKDAIASQLLRNAKEKLEQNSKEVSE